MIHIAPERLPFRILLRDQEWPQMPLEFDALRAHNDNASPAKGRKSGSTRAHVLVVEDDRAVLDLAATILRNEGFEIVTALDGAEALALTDEQIASIDLLVADVQMPDIDGPTLAEQLVRRAPMLKVMYMSAWVDPISSSPTVPLDSDFLPKPFGYGELVAKVRESLQVSA